MKSIWGRLQNVSDWADFSDEFDIVNKLKTGKALTEEIAELTEKTFRVFCAREKQQMRGGIGSPKDFYVYHIAMVKDRDELIVPLPEDEED